MKQIKIEPPALKEIRALLSWSRQRFGDEAARNYEKLLRRAYNLLREDPLRPNVQRREDLPRTPYTFHIRHARIRGLSPKHARHIIVFTYDEATLYVLRVLHDSMDISDRVGDEANDT